MRAARWQNASLPRYLCFNERNWRHLLKYIGWSLLALTPVLGPELWVRPGHRGPGLVALPDHVPHGVSTCTSPACAFKHPGQQARGCGVVCRVAQSDPGVWQTKLSSQSPNKEKHMTLSPLLTLREPQGIQKTPGDTPNIS